MMEHASAILVWLKPRSMRGASHHSAFMGSSLTISHMFLAFPTQWMSSLSWKCERWIGPRLHLIVDV